MWDAKPGMKVVCIRELQPLIPNPLDILPVIGQKYTIRDVESAWNGEEFIPALRLVEIVNRLTLYHTAPGVAEIGEMIFPLVCFRPLVSSTGMQTLEAILKNPNATIKGFEQAKVKIKEHTK